MATISEEVVNCQLLLENIFPQEVLERLKQRDGGGGDRHAAVLAEEFHGCTFLFAKVADPASLPLPHTPTPNPNPSPTPSSSQGRRPQAADRGRGARPRRRDQRAAG